MVRKTPNGDSVTFFYKILILELIVVLSGLRGCLAGNDRSLAAPEAHFYGHWAGRRRRLKSSLSPFQHPEIEMNLIGLIDKKIREELRFIDQKTESQVRDLWSTVTQAPTCPSASKVIKNINKVCHTGLLQRGKVIQDAVINTIKEIEGTINKETIENILAIAKKHFPENQFVALVENTKGVYQSGNIPSHKYCERSFRLEITAIKSPCAANLSRQAIGVLKTNLEEIDLKKDLKKPNVFSTILNWFAIPASKWVFSVIGSVIAALILFWLGIKD